MKRIINIRTVAIALLLYTLLSCEDYLEIEAPDHKMISEVVFNNDETAMSAMTGIYNELFRAPFSSGGRESVTALGGLSADDLTTIRTNNLAYLEYDQHEVLPDNSKNIRLWSSAYNIIYMANSLMEGLANSDDISEEVREQLEGEALFVRAFTYFYLVNLYGEVPMILTTDYQVNAQAPRVQEEMIYSKITEDLETATGLLGEDYLQGERTQVNLYTATALLARVQLYSENWEAAETLSSQVINQNNTYEILEDPDQVFLANSREALWQLSPIGGGGISTNTNEGSILIIHPFLSFLSDLKLNDSFVTSFGEEDKRFLSWIGFHQGTQSYYSNKYKIQNSTEEVTEYSMVLRLAEQYLIRAEARAMQGDLEGSIADLDKIRERAGLELIAETNPGIGKEELLELIFEERKKELFTEWGHRWLDLKRTGRAGEVLGAGNALWQETDVLYPVPEAELMKNYNLTQNDGY